MRYGRVGFRSAVFVAFCSYSGARAQIIVAHREFQCTCVRILCFLARTSHNKCVISVLFGQSRFILVVIVSLSRYVALNEFGRLSWSRACKNAV